MYVNITIVLQFILNEFSDNLFIIVTIKIKGVSMNRQERFHSLAKYKFGVASVLLGLFWYLDL